MCYIEKDCVFRKRSWKLEVRSWKLEVRIVQLLASNFQNFPYFHVSYTQVLPFSDPQKILILKFCRGAHDGLRSHPLT
jgi:hypothetical protein